MLHHDDGGEARAGRFGRLRLATVLAHTVPGVSLILRCRSGEVLRVADQRLDAHLTPCQLRRALITVPRAGLPHVVDVVVGVTVGGEIEELGAGVYGRRDGGSDQRWLATHLPVAPLVELLDSCPVEIPDDAMGVDLRPDPELQATAVRITAAHPAYACRVDEVALWAVSACAVEELVRDVRREVPSR